MSLVPSLLQAIVRVDGEALVMHAGDKPYVVSPTGQIELANRGLTLDAVNGIVNQLLPAELQQALDEFGAVQSRAAADAGIPGRTLHRRGRARRRRLWPRSDGIVYRTTIRTGGAVCAHAHGCGGRRVAAGGVAVAPPAQERRVAQPAAVVSQPVAEMKTAAPPAAAAPAPQGEWQAEPLPPVVPTPMTDEIAEEDLDARLDEEDDDLNLPDASQLWPARPPLRPAKKRKRARRSS